MCTCAHVQTKRACSYRLQGPPSWVLSKVLRKEVRLLPVGGECSVVDEKASRSSHPHSNGKAHVGSCIRRPKCPCSPIKSTHTHTRLVDLTGAVSEMMSSFFTSMKQPGVVATVRTSGSYSSSSSSSGTRRTSDCTLNSLLMSPRRLKTYRYSVVHIRTRWTDPIWSLDNERFDVRWRHRRMKRESKFPVVTGVQQDIKHGEVHGCR